MRSGREKKEINGDWLSVLVLRQEAGARSDLIDTLVPDLSVVFLLDPLDRL